VGGVVVEPPWVLAAVVVLVSVPVPGVLRDSNTPITMTPTISALITTTIQA